MFGRVERLYAEVERELRAGRNVAAVGHFWSVRMLLAVLTGQRFEEYLARGAGFHPQTGSVLRAQLAPEDGGRLRVVRTSSV